MFVSECPSPVGRLWIVSSAGWITGVHFLPQDGLPGGSLALHRAAQEQLEEYFAGLRREFSLPLRPAGTPFQLAVWRALEAIPYGETRSYGEIAAAMGRPKAARAVGMANHRNPISIIIPCHRVIGSTGEPVGYGGGLEKKLFLLELEKRTG